MTDASHKKEGFKKCRSATFSIDGYSFTIGENFALGPFFFFFGDLAHSLVAVASSKPGGGGHGNLGRGCWLEGALGNCDLWGKPRFSCPCYSIALASIPLESIFNYASLNGSFHAEIWVTRCRRGWIEMDGDRDGDKNKEEEESEKTEGSGQTWRQRHRPPSQKFRD